MWTAFPVLGRPEASSANSGPKSPPQEPPENPPLRALLDPIRPQDTCKTQLKADRDVNNRFLENAHGASAGATFLALTRGQNSGKKYFRSHPQSNVDRIPGQKRGRAKKQGKWSLVGKGGESPPPHPGAPVTASVKSGGPPQGGSRGVFEPQNRSHTPDDPQRGSADLF